jgi:pimeloyl-ACP methyl ester carboxylesterase
MLDSSTTGASRPIVLIHGLFLNWQSWDNWAERYRARGFTVFAPGWPGLDRTVEELREDPAPLTQLSIEKVLDYLDAFIRKLEEPPIIMGHSFGGLFAQLLGYRGLGSAVVGVDATAPAGVLDLPFSTLKGSAPVLANPLNVGKATMLTPEQFHYAFTNTVSDEDNEVLYDRYAVPCANRILFEGAFENFVPHSPAHVDVASDRPPILLIAGAEDHLVPPGYTKKNYDLIARSPAITAFKEFSGRPHFTGGVPGWETVADYAIQWALAPAASSPQNEPVLT